MITPVTETYIQIGHVQRARRACLTKSAFQARKRVMRTRGRIAAARIVWDIKIAK
jgi:hypothetical protein